MRILLAGGGSGGHVTPLKAIADEINEQQKNAQIMVVVDGKFFHQTEQLFKQDNVSIRKIKAGKLRRFVSKSLLWHFYHLPVLYWNLRDVFFTIFGCLQSLLIMFKFKPEVVFCKGGFVCIPIGLAAHLTGKKLVIHDSDTRPGLTNRILSRWADAVATGMPAEFYNYNKEISTHVGMPVSPAYKPLSDKEQIKYKIDLGFEKDQSVLLVTGGGNGAEALNKEVETIAKRLLEDGWAVIHLAGKGKTGSAEKAKNQLPIKLQKAWQIEGFADMVPRLLAADIVVCRTSASTLQECANAKKVVIGIPSQHLEDQQLNAKYFADNHAIIHLDESTFSSSKTELLAAINDFKNDPKKASNYAKNLHDSFAKPDAAKKLAKIILQAAN